MATTDTIKVLEKITEEPRDHLLAVDDLGLPKVLTMARIEPGIMNTAIMTIIRLIRMRKGTDPDRPDMCIDIVGRYRFAFETELITLQYEIEDQITTYLPEFLPVSVTATMVTDRADSNYLNKIQINITIDKVQYQLLYDKEAEELDIFAR